MEKKITGHTIFMNQCLGEGSYGSVCFLLFFRFMLVLTQKLNKNVQSKSSQDLQVIFSFMKSMMMNMPKRPSFLKFPSWRQSNPPMWSSFTILFNQTKTITSSRNFVKEICKISWKRRKPSMKKKPSILWKIYSMDL